MSLKKLPEIKAFEAPSALRWDSPSDAMQHWAEGPMAAEGDDETTISIFDPIGRDIWGDGVTARRISGALRAIGERDVRVRINSPGGDLFEGIAIYNLLRAHPAKVTIEVMGIAASAASVIAMAGDEIRMGPATFLMIHNAWVVVVGNQYDVQDTHAVLVEIDNAMIGLYEARSGLGRKKISDMMRAETYLSAKTAVERGFADAVDDTVPSPSSDGPEGRNSGLMARRQLEALMAQSGMTREARSELLSEAADHIVSRRDARDDETAARDAGISAALTQLINSIKS